MTVILPPTTCSYKGGKRPPTTHVIRDVMKRLVMPGRHHIMLRHNMYSYPHASSRPKRLGSTGGGAVGASYSTLGRAQNAQRPVMFNVFGKWALLHVGHGLITTIDVCILVCFTRPCMLATRPFLGAGEPHQ